MGKSKNGTLAYIFSKDKILLGAKKYGGAKGKLNGFGGKIEDSDKDIYEAVKREVFEETNLEILDPELHGILIFNQKYKKERNIVFLFKIRDFNGQIQESDEMTVEWFKTNKIPKDKMWDSDKYWFDYILQDRKFELELSFNSQNSLCDEIHVKFLKDIDEKYIQKG